MKTVTAISADGKRKLRVPIIAEAGAFSVGKGVDLRHGNRRIQRYWVVYHTKTGSVMGPDGWSRKGEALRFLKRVAAIEGDWNRPAEALMGDLNLRKKYSEVYWEFMVETGRYIKLA